MDEGTEPQPDIALVRERWRGHPARHPGPHDIFLLVEVSDASVQFDSEAKRELYARSGIQEYWIVDLTKDVVRVHRGPTACGYASKDELSASARLEIQALPGIAIEAAPLFN